MLGPGCNMGQTVTVTSTQVTLMVASSSTINPCTVTFVALQVQPAIGAGLASNHITKTGTSGAPGGGTSYGLLTKVADAPKNLTFTTQPSATNTAGTAFATAPVVSVKDQFGNNVSKASVTLSIAPGTGPAGACLTCPTNPVVATSLGAATFTVLQDRHGGLVQASCLIRRWERRQRHGHGDRGPRTTRYYRVSFAGAADLCAATSPVARVVVRALVFLRPAGCTSSTGARSA